VQRMMRNSTFAELEQEFEDGITEARMLVKKAFCRPKD